MHLAEREAAWVAQHQIVQTADGRIRLDIRPSVPPRSEDIERVRGMARRILGFDTPFELALVARFPPHPSGKFQPYVSLIEPTRAVELTA